MRSEASEDSWPTSYEGSREPVDTGPKSEEFALSHGVFLSYQ